MAAEPRDQVEFHQSLPTKRMAAGALLFDEADQLLIVKPTYKESWEIPGGAVEADESPAQACRREIAEELSLDITPTQLLCVDYNSSTSDYVESLMFLFAAPVLSKEQREAIVLPPSELSEFRFCDPATAVSLLGHRLGPRLAAVLADPSAIYLEDQQPLATCGWL